MAKREIFFGRNLKNVRNMKGVTQEQLAESLHVTRQTISVWESGHGNPDIYMLDEILDFFEISYDELMHFSHIDIQGHEISDEIDFGNYAVPVDIYEERNYLDTIEEPGYYTIIEDDIQEFFPVIRIGYERLMAIILELHELGYIITEVFDNGLSVYLPTVEIAKKMSKDIYNIIDGFIHRDNERAIRNQEAIEEETAKVYLQTLKSVSTKIWGKEPSDFKYYWIDEMGNPRGYADSKEEIDRQIKIQNCKEVTIIENH